MLAFKRLVNVVVMVYLLLALLFILMPASRDSVMSLTGLSGADLATFYNTMFVIGAALLALELIVENLYNVTLKQDLARQSGKVNELKARLYDHQMEQRDRELQQRPVITGAPVNPTRPAAPVAPAAPIAPAPATTTSTTRLDPVYVTPTNPEAPANLPPTTNVGNTPPHSHIPPASAADLDTPRTTQ